MVLQAIPFIALCCAAIWLTACSTNRPSSAAKRTFSSFDAPTGRAGQRQFEPGGLKLEEAELTQVLTLYQEMSGRTVLRASTLPSVKISLRNQTPLNRVEALQLLDTVLAQNGITMVLLGDSSVKAVTVREAVTETAPTIDLPADELPTSSSYMTRTVRLKNMRPRDVAPMLQPLAKMPNSIVAIDSGGVVVLRDYSGNIRQMLHLLQEVESREKR